LQWWLFDETGYLITLQRELPPSQNYGKSVGIVSMTKKKKLVMDAPSEEQKLLLPINASKFHRHCCCHAREHRPGVMIRGAGCGLGLGKLIGQRI
jgi:hypothetical protein